MTKFILTLLLLFIFSFPSISSSNGTLNKYSKVKQVRDFFLKTEYKEVTHIILSISMLESTWLKNESHVCRHNYFSLKGSRGFDCNNQPCDKPICKMRKFDTFEDGLKGQLEYFRKYEYPTTEKAFYDALLCVPYYKNRGSGCKKYAHDPNHTTLIKGVIKSLRKRKLI